MVKRIKILFALLMKEYGPPIKYHLKFALKWAVFIFGSFALTSVMFSQLFDLSAFLVLYWNAFLYFTICLTLGTSGLHYLFQKTTARISEKIKSGTDRLENLWHKAGEVAQNEDVQGAISMTKEK